MTGRRARAGARSGAGTRPGRGAGWRERGLPHGALPAGRGLRQSPDELRRRQEQVLLATMINHPEILSEHAEDLAGLDLAGADLRRLARALVDLAAGAPDLDTEALKCHLTEQGFTGVLDGLLSRRVYVHGGFARPETPLGEARSKWADMLALHRQRQAAAETAEAARLLAEDPSEERLAWLQARQRSAEGGRRSDVGSDSLETADSGEPS